MTSYRKHLVVMVKAPVAGRVKTRLSADLGPGRATMIYRHMVQVLLSRLVQSQRWDTVLAVDPDKDVATPVFASDVVRVGQGGGDLGQRMHGLMVELPPGPVVIIGSDTPGVDVRQIDQAFQALGQTDAVIGPALDGGYWLIGLKRFPTVPNIFTNVRWSTEHAFTDTLGNMRGLRVSRLEMLDDIDNGRDFLRGSDLCGRRILPKVARV